MLQDPGHFIELECVVTTQMAANWVFRAQQVVLGPRNSGHIRPLRKSILCFVSCGFRLQRGWCTSQAQNLKFRSQNFELQQ